MNFLIRLRPADALNFLFLLGLTIITVFFSHRLPQAWTLVLLYSGLILSQALLIMFQGRGRLMHWTYHLIFPTLCILAIFDSLELLVHNINPQDIDPLLIRADFLIFSGHPTVMLEALMSPLLTEALQLAYLSYYLLPVTLGAALLLKKDVQTFDRALFLIMLCFYLSYAGYLLFPALGPRFTMRHLQTVDLQGLVLAGPLQEILNLLEGTKRDAFPSGHTAIALTVLFIAWRHVRRLFAIFIPFVAALIVSTVYLRYHYVVDVLAGFALTALTLIMGEAFYGYSRNKRTDPDR
jgi:membrane-associated phospholipid phosphatase